MDIDKVACSRQEGDVSCNHIPTVPELDTELSPSLAAISYSDVARKSCQKDIEAAWERVTCSLHTGPCILKNLQEVGALKVAIKLLLSPGAQGDFSVVQMETIRSLDELINQLELRFKKAEKMLAIVRVMKEQVAKDVSQSFSRCTKCKEELSKWNYAEEKAKEDTAAVESTFKKFKLYMD